MRVTLLELPAAHGEVRGQLERVRRALASGPPTDLVLLPEASLTGYVSPEGDFDLARFAEPLDGDTATALSAIAAEHAVHLVGPLVEREGRHVYNAMIGFGPSRERFLHYRKRHPWVPEGWATPGEHASPLAHVHGRALTIAICFDVHFLIDEASNQLSAADVLLFPSAWVQDEDSRASMLPELARRFDVAIVNANWGAGSPRVAGQGGSMIVGRSGEVLAVATDGRADAEI